MLFLNAPSLVDVEIYVDVLKPFLLHYEVECAWNSELELESHLF